MDWAGEMSINRVCISGNLTRDSELRYTASGMAILSFGVAVNERRKNDRGEWQDYPNFVDCVLFGKYGETMQRHLAKGTKVAIEGRLRYSSWERDGQRRSRLEVIADEVVTFAPRQQGAPQQQQQPAYSAPTPSAAPVQHSVPQIPVPPAPSHQPMYDEDIPF